jgi:hypothetical protein
VHRLCDVSLRALVVLSVLLAAGASRAATYYVATTGNDANAGSQVAPWRTLQKAGNVAAAGDTVNVLPGTYAGFRPLHSGTAAAPIRFVAQAGVIVNTPGTANSNGDNIWVRDVDYIVIDGFESTAAPRSASPCRASPTATWPGRDPQLQLPSQQPLGHLHRLRPRPAARGQRDVLLGDRARHLRLEQRRPSDRPPQPFAPQQRFRHPAQRRSGADGRRPQRSRG